MLGKEDYFSWFVIGSSNLWNIILTVYTVLSLYLVNWMMEIVIECRELLWNPSECIKNLSKDFKLTAASWNIESGKNPKVLAWITFTSHPSQG